MSHHVEMAFYGSSDYNCRFGDSREGYTLTNSTDPRFQNGSHVPADPGIHQKLDSLLTMVFNQNEALDPTNNGLQELRKTVTRLETRVLEMEKENLGQHVKEKKLPTKLSVGSSM